MKFICVTRMLSRIVCLEKVVHCRNCAYTGARKRIIIRFGQISVLTWYGSQIKSSCRIISEALDWTRKDLVLVFLSVCLCGTQQRSQKFSDSLEIWHKLLCFIRNWLCSLCCTLPKFRVYWDAQNFLSTLRPMDGTSC